MRYRVLPYRQGSKSAKALAEALGGRVLRLQGSSFSPAVGDVIINWGNTTSTWATDVDDAPVILLEPLGECYLLNAPARIRAASNKRTFFRLMRDAGHEALIPHFWENSNEIPDSAFPVVCRTVLAGHSGDGIIIADNRDDLVPSPLYVQYVKKQEEYRVHVGRVLETVGNGSEYMERVIAVQRKARRHDVPDEQVNWKVRNHSNGFVFVRQGFVPPPAVLDVAKIALYASGLDFGAVDVIWNQEKQRAYVLEINTAPGLEGQTVTDYANFFRGE